jgi:predicted RNase H-like nuclease (RuvC/YqgF family)
MGHDINFLRTCTNPHTTATQAGLHPGTEINIRSHSDVPHRHFTRNPVMPKRSTSSPALLATALAALLLGGTSLAQAAQAGIEFSPDNGSSSDSIGTLRRDSHGVYTLHNSRFSANDLQNLQDSLKRSNADVESLKKTVSEQARLIEELKRNNGSSSSSNDQSSLKRSVSDQERQLDKLSKQVEDLKRNGGSGSSSNSSELSDLKRTVSNQDRQLDRLERSLDELSRKVR